MLLCFVVKKLLFDTRTPPPPLTAYTTAHVSQGLWRIEYLNTGRANSPKMWLFSLLPVVAQVGVVVAN